MGKEKGVGRPTIRVRVEPELADIVPIFLEHRREDVARLRDALAADDLETVERLGHSMKGTGGGYGFPPVADIGDRLERAAMAGERDAIPPMIAELADYLERLELVHDE